MLTVNNCLKMFRFFILSAAMVLTFNPINTSAQSPVYCSAPIEGSTDFASNLIAIITDVKDEKMCDDFCQIEQGCKVYTYHPVGSPTDSEYCYLLTTLEGPIIECQENACVSGLPNCEGSVCTYIEGGVMFPDGIVVTGEDKNIELLNLGNCPSPVAVAIGDGGASFNGGAGSGYVEYTTDLPQNAYIKMTAHPGECSLDDESDNCYDPNEGSYVREFPDNTTILTSRRGRAGDGSSAGEGEQLI